MSCYNTVSRSVSITVSGFILKKELKSLEDHQIAMENKLQRAVDTVEKLVYEEGLERCKGVKERIEIMTEEVEVMRLLKLLVDVMDRYNMGLAMKSKWLVDENRWLASQINDFRVKLSRLEKEWITLEAERHFKLYFFKMRNSFPSEDYTEEIEVFDIASSVNSAAYEPEEFYSPELKPFFKIVSEHMLEWQNEVAISWCRDILNYYKDKEGDLSTNVCDLHGFIGRIYKVNRQYADSKYHFSKALKIQETLKQNDNQRGITQTFLGIINEKQKHYKEAEMCFKKALVCRETTMGRFHTDISDLYCRLGRLYNKMGNWKESLVHYSIALPALEHTFDESDPQILLMYLTLADDYIELKIEDKARLFIDKLSKLTISKLIQDDSLLSPIINIQEMQNVSSKLPKGFNILTAYGPIQKCCSRELIASMSKFFTCFKKVDALQLLIEWCDLSSFPYECVKYFPQIAPIPPTELKRVSSKDSISSVKSARLQSIRRFIKNPIETVKRHM